MIMTDRYRIYQIMRDGMVLATFDPRHMAELDRFVESCLDDEKAFTIITRISGIDGVDSPMAADSFYTVDHYKSDKVYHTYCGECLMQIPTFLVRYSDKLHPTARDADGEPIECEGCGHTNATS